MLGFSGLTFLELGHGSLCRITSLIGLKLRDVLTCLDNLGNNQSSPASLCPAGSAGGI